MGESWGGVSLEIFIVVRFFFCSSSVSFLFYLRLSLIGLDLSSSFYFIFVRFVEGLFGRFYAFLRC